MTRLVVTEQPPLPETIRIVEAAVGRALVWQPLRWVPETPQPPEYRIPQGDEDGAA